MDLNRVLLLFFFLAVPEAALAANYLGAAYLTCMHNTTEGTALSSTFKQNLNFALSNLTALSLNGTQYAITSAGSGDDIVYAMFQCRGDQTSDLCRDCMANATVRLPESDCPNFIGARIQLDGCYLRYDNQSFFTLDTTYVIGYCYAPSSDPIALAAIQSIMDNVTTQAPKQGGFASASANDEYAVAQCLGYLNESECSQCLSTYNYRTVCNSTLGEQLHLTSCYYRYEPYSFFENASLPPLLPPSPSPSPPPPGRPAGAASPATKNETHKGSKIQIIVICSIVGATIAIVALCIILVRRYKAKQIRGLRWSKEGASLPRSLLETKAKMFLLQELQDATMNFHPNNKLGQGGFGPVYKGTLLDGEQVAIKKLAIGSQQGKREFQNEVNLITSVQHKNLVRLLGSCVEGNERILVYEYLPNGSLDFLLFGEREGGRTLDWSTRFQIVLGMAKGLAYLHEESHVRIIHRDIKPSNILLDDELNPVIADFGLARLIQDDESQINTRIAGTIGYLAPEYAMHGDFSAKIDVFSFGLVSLEIVSGKKNINGRLLPQVWQLYLQNKVLDLVDTNLDNSFTQEEAIRIIHVALLCTQDNPKARPTMSTATLWLLGRSEILQTPKKPMFVDLSEIREYESAMDYQLGTNISSNEFSHISGGKQSISKIDPR
eukprot:c25360_g1_i1 orf=219-2207(-)